MDRRLFPVRSGRVLLWNKTLRLHCWIDLPTISTIGKVPLTQEETGNLVILVPVRFEANHIHVLRLTTECSKNKGTGKRSSLRRVTVRIS
jgi:hypothetical protein